MVFACAALMSFLVNMQTRIALPLMSTPGTCDSYIFSSVIYDSWHADKELLIDPVFVTTPCENGSQACFNP